jgi:hypothetical protein
VKKIRSSYPFSCITLAIVTLVLSGILSLFFYTLGHTLGGISTVYKAFLFLVLCLGRAGSRGANLFNMALGRTPRQPEQAPQTPENLQIEGGTPNRLDVGCYPFSLLEYSKNCDFVRNYILGRNKDTSYLVDQAFQKGKRTA